LLGNLVVWQGSVVAAERVQRSASTQSPAVYVEW